MVPTLFRTKAFPALFEIHNQAEGTGRFAGSLEPRLATIWDPVERVFSPQPGAPEVGLPLGVELSNLGDSVSRVGADDVVVSVRD